MPTPTDAVAPFDQAALERLYVALEKPLYNAVYRWVWNADDAADIVQDAFVRLWRMRERVITETAKPLAYRIALNLAANRRRSKRLWRWVGLEDDDVASEHDPVLSIAERQREQTLKRAIDQLPEKLRQVVALCEISELSYDEAAVVLGVAVGTIGSRRNAAVMRLAQALGGSL